MLQRQAHKKKHRENPIETPTPTTSDLLRHIALGATMSLGARLMTNLFDGQVDPVRSQLAELVIDYGITDVEAALARIKLRIEAVES